jgi:hypothetical protein
MIAGIGFARMAWELAVLRALGYSQMGLESPVKVRRGCCARCVEYYRICDEAEAAWRNREDNGYTVHL